MPWGVLLWHRPWHQHSKIRPIRAQYLNRSGPMRVLYSPCSVPHCRPEDPCSPDQSDSLRPPGLTVHSESSTGSSPTCCSTARRRGSLSWWCTRCPQSGRSTSVGGGTVGSSSGQQHSNVSKEGRQFWEVLRAKSDWIYNLLLTD